MRSVHQIFIIIYSLFLSLYFVIFFIVFFLLLALRYAKSHTTEGANGWGGHRFHKGPRRSFVGLWGRL